MAQDPRKNLTLALNLGALVIGMVLLAYASVPLYRLFCEATGFGGTPRTAAMHTGKAEERIIEVRFNADTDPALPWDFQPLEPRLMAHVGDNIVTHYHVHNRDTVPVTGHAVYNVLPHKAGPYFVKIACFCFENQTFAPGEQRDLPVTFFLDPTLMSDPEMRDVHTITLSYTFFEVTKK